MKKMLLAAAALCLLAASPTPSSEGITPMLKMHTTYNFVFGSGFVSAAPLPGRSPGTVWGLAWQGTVQGDINGVIRWWVEFTPPDGFGSVGRWELWDCEPSFPSPGCNFDDPAQLIMAGNDVFAYVTDVDWEGKGIVTYARGDYADWLGRRITDGGYVDFVGGFPFYGEGPFVIYNRPSNKH